MRLSYNTLRRGFFDFKTEGALVKFVPNKCFAHQEK